MAKKSKTPAASPAAGTLAIETPAEEVKAKPITELTVKRRFAMLPLSSLRWTHDRSIGDDISPGSDSGNESLAALVASVKENGVETPVEVELGDFDENAPGGGTYNVFAGRRRCEASKRAELKEVPCLIYENVPPGFKELRGFRENLLRKQLTPYETLTKMRELSAHLAAAQIAAEIGQSDRHVANVLRVANKLIPEYMQRLKMGLLTMKDAIALASKTPEDQLSLFKGAPLAPPAPRAPAAPAIAPGSTASPAAIEAAANVNAPPAPPATQSAPPPSGETPIITVETMKDREAAELKYLLEKHGKTFGERSGGETWKASLALLVQHPRYDRSFLETALGYVLDVLDSQEHEEYSTMVDK